MAKNFYAASCSDFANKNKLGKHGPEGPCELVPFFVAPWAFSVECDRRRGRFVRAENASLPRLLGPANIPDASEVGSSVLQMLQVCRVVLEKLLEN